MPTEVDRFPEFLESIRDTANRERIASIAGEAVRDQQRFMFGRLVFWSPRAAGDTFMSTGHDHTAIEDGWRYGSVSQTGNGAEASMDNVSEHVDVQRSGTLKKKYEIPHPGTRKQSRPGGLLQTYGKSQLAFWLGSPLKWGVKSARFQKAGFVYMDRVTHLGFGPHGGRDFVEVAAESGRGEMESIARDAGREIAFRPLEEFFSS